MHLLGFTIFSEAWLFDLAVYIHFILGLYIIIWETKRSEWWCLGVLSVTTVVLVFVTWLDATKEHTDFFQLTWHAVHLGIGLVALAFGLMRPAKEVVHTPQQLTSEFEQQALAKKEPDNAPLPNFVEESASPEMMAASPSAVKATPAAASEAPTPAPVVPEPAAAPVPVPTPSPSLTTPAVPALAVAAAQEAVTAAAPRPAGAPPPVPGKARPKPQPVAEYEAAPIAQQDPNQNAHQDQNEPDNALLDPEPEPYQSQPSKSLQQHATPSAYSPPPGTQSQGVPRKAEPRNPETPRTRGPLPAGISPMDSSLSRYANEQPGNDLDEVASVPRKPEPRKPGQQGGPPGLGKPALPSGRTGPLPRMSPTQRPPGSETIIETPTLASTQPFKILPHAPPPQEVYTPQVRTSQGASGSTRQMPLPQNIPGPLPPGAGPGPGLGHGPGVGSSSIGGNASTTGSFPTPALKRLEGNRGMPSTTSSASPVRNKTTQPPGPGPAQQAQQLQPVQPQPQNRQLPPAQQQPVRPQQQPPAQQQQPPPAGSMAIQPVNRAISTVHNQSPAANSAAAAFVNALKDRIAPFLEENVDPELIAPGREEELRRRVEELVDMKFAQDGVNPGPRLRAMLLQDLYRDIPLLSDEA